MNILRADHVSYSYRTKYQKVDAVRDVSCTFEQGGFYAIIGESGSGKSTFLSLLAGLDVPSEGEIYVQEQPLNQMDRDAYRLNQASVVYQSFHLFPLLTALENVMLPMEFKKIRKKEAADRAAKLLLRVGLTERIFRQFPKMMSGGEQQRVAIARALVNNPSMIIADEPTGNLDPARSYEIMLLLEEINNLGTTVLVVTHERELVERFTKRVIAIDDGKVISDGMDGYYHYEEQ